MRTSCGVARSGSGTPTRTKRLGVVDADDVEIGHCVQSTHAKAIKPAPSGDDRRAESSGAAPRRSLQEHKRDQRAPNDGGFAQRRHLRDRREGLRPEHQAVAGEADDADADAAPRRDRGVRQQALDAAPPERKRRSSARDISAIVQPTKDQRVARRARAKRIDQRVRRNAKADAPAPKASPSAARAGWRRPCSTPIETNAMPSIFSGGGISCAVSAAPNATSNGADAARERVDVAHIAGVVAFEQRRTNRRDGCSTESAR